MKRCVECNGHALVEGEVTETRAVAGRTFTARMPATICADCKASYVSGPVLECFDLMVVRGLADVGEHSGEALKFMRKALGMTSAELGGILDVTPESVSRWETGKHAPSPSVIGILAAMADDRLEGRTTTLMRLRALHEPKPADAPRDLGRVARPVAA